MSGGLVPRNWNMLAPYEVPSEEDSLAYVNNVTFSGCRVGMLDPDGAIVPSNKSIRFAGSVGKSITVIMTKPASGNENQNAAHHAALWAYSSGEWHARNALGYCTPEVGTDNVGPVTISDWDPVATANQWRIVKGSRLFIDQNMVVMPVAPSEVLSSERARAMANSVGVSVLDLYKNHGFQMLGAVLPDLSRSDRFVAHPDVNVVHQSEVDSLLRTAAVLKTAARLDDREVSILEAKQQRNAILLSKDFRAALQVLMDEEQFSNYDLSAVIGVTRAVLTGWRARPLEKLWGTSQTRMGRLLFAWKYWLHVAEGEPLGQYLRDVPETSATSLLDLLSQKEPTEEEIASHIDRLAAYAKEDRRAAAERRRDIGGLPHSAYRKDVAFD